MALAEYGLYAGEYSQEEIERLAFAWLRRKKLEARLIATEVGLLFGGKSKQEDRVSSDQMWAMLEEL